jgi:hypothetical protein
MTPGRQCAVLALALTMLLPVAGGPARAEPRTFDLAIGNGELPKQSRVVRVRQGDDVTLRWSTDAPLTIHLHGYDLEQKLAPGPAAAMRFTARATGRFPIEVHTHHSGSDRTLGYLEVHPR